VWKRLLVVLALVAVSGCSEVGQRIDDATNDAAARALEAAVSERLADAGIELSGDPECTTDLDRDGTALTGTADCTATTSQDQTATATFDGTLSTSGCEGSLTVAIEGETVINVSDIPGCSVAL
jgi:heat shock protein HslJ